MLLLPQRQDRVLSTREGGCVLVVRDTDGVRDDAAERRYRLAAGGKKKKKKNREITTKDPDNRRQTDARIHNRTSRFIRKSNNEKRDLGDRLEEIRRRPAR